MPAPNIAVRQGRVRSRRHKPRSKPPAEPPAAQRPQRRRRRNANTNPLYDVARQLGGKQLKKAANDLAALEFDPAQQALQREAEQVTTQGSALTGRASDYYLQLAREEQGNIDKLAAINQMVGGQVQQAGATAQGAITAADQEAQRLARESAPGAAGLGAGGQVLAETQAARNRAAGNTLDATLSSGAATQAAAGLANTGRQARSMQGGETLAQLTNLVAGQLAENRGKQTSLAGQRASAVKKNVLDLRQQGFENLVTQEGLGIKSAELAAEVAQQQSDAALARRRLRQTGRQNRARNRLTARGQDVTARGQDVTARGQDINAQQRTLDRASREKIANRRIRYGAAKKDEPADVRKFKSGITNARVDIEDMLTTGEIPPGLRRTIRDTAPGLLKRPVNADTARRVIIALGGPSIVAKAAAELAENGAVTPSTRRALRLLGMRVPRDWFGPVKVPNRPGVTL